MNRLLAVRVTTVSAVFGLCVAPAYAEATAAAAKRQVADAESSTLPAKTRQARAAKYCLIEETTGSRIAKKICLSKAEWQARGVEITN